MEQDIVNSAKRSFLQAFEKKLYAFVDQKLKEQAIDFIVLYTRRNNIRIEQEQMDAILNVLRLAIDDSFQKNIDNLLKDLEPNLENVVQAVNPLNSTDSKKA